jgi:DNA-binding CsgD family transcriptional regulator
MREAEATLAQRESRSRAAAALSEARAIATHLGAVPLLRATERLAVRARIALDPVASPPDPRVGAVAAASEPPHPARGADRDNPIPRGRLDLTPREREVLALLGAGRSNDEIGALLYVSGKTVSVHITNIKAKLGASSRVQIAMYAIESGMVETRLPEGEATVARS